MAGKTRPQEAASSGNHDSSRRRWPWHDVIVGSLTVAARSRVGLHSGRSSIGRAVAAATSWWFDSTRPGSFRSCLATVAQWKRQRFQKPSSGGSNPPGGIRGKSENRNAENRNGPFVGENCGVYARLAFQFLFSVFSVSVFVGAVAQREEPSARNR